jgi:hypothetical protein
MRIVGSDDGGRDIGPMQPTVVRFAWREPVDLIPRLSEEGSRLLDRGLARRAGVVARRALRASTAVTETAFSPCVNPSSATAS